MTFIHLSFTCKLQINFIIEYTLIIFTDRILPFMKDLSLQLMKQKLFCKKFIDKSTDELETHRGLLKFAALTAQKNFLDLNSVIFHDKK